MPLDAATREGDRLVGPFSALWYLVFVLPLFLFATPDRSPKPLQARAVKAGLAQLARSVKDLVRHHGQVALFLLARMLYADGLGAVFTFGGIYGASVFGWGHRTRTVRHHPDLAARSARARRRARRSARLESGDRRDASSCSSPHPSACCQSIRGHVLFVVPVEPKLPGSAPVLQAWASRSISPSPC